MNRTVTQSMRDVDVVILVIEAMHFDERDKHGRQASACGETAVILAINKVDRLADKSQMLPFLEKMAKEFAFAAIVPISAERGTQLPASDSSTVRPYLPQKPPLFSEDEVTDRSERFIAAELVREKLFRLLGEEIPYSTSVVIDQFTTEGELRKIHASIIVDKPNQKAIVIGKGGEKLKLIATTARKDMEESFGGKVYLKVWVKVKSGWADDARVLKTLGMRINSRLTHKLMTADKQRQDAQPAFILHTYPYRETSLMVEAFTRNFGRVPLLAKGAKRPKSALKRTIAGISAVATQLGREIGIAHVAQGGMARRPHAAAGDGPDLRFLPQRIADAPVASQ